MMMVENVEALLEKAEQEEKAYNWVEAAMIYEKVVNYFLNEKNIKKAAEIYYKLGIACYRAADTIDTIEERGELIKNSINAFEEATNLYKQSGNKPEELECNALELLVRSLNISSIIESKKAFSQSLELLLEASELYYKENFQDKCARSLSWAVMVSVILVFLCIDPKEIEEFLQKGIEIANKAWKLSKDLDNIQMLAEIISNEGYLINVTFQIKDYKQLSEAQIRNYLRKCEESLNIIEGCKDFGILALVYGAAGYGYGGLAYADIEDEIEQTKYFDKGIELFEKSLEFARKTKDKSGIMRVLCSLIWFAQFSGKINYLQKRIMNDLSEVVELGTIYRDRERVIEIPILHGFSNLFLAVYYSGFAQMSFFTPAQRKSYAKKGVEHGLKALKRCTFGPYIAQINQVLTWSYSQLAVLAIDKRKQSDFIKKMLEYANQASEIGEKYEGGWGRAAGYSSIYKAYKTLADIAESEAERIKMLTIAINASRELNKHPIGSRTGIIASQLRLGLLYEELGVLTINDDTLVKAKEVILNVNKISLERGYISYAAAAFEYVARIEDRLGNHTASAKFYEKAQSTYAESLKNIEYKLLKKRVNEKMNYTNAWNLIESAKAFHKMENHLKAQESYQNAVELLKNLKNFNYEASYYNAWASQEEAERLSKLEKHEKAIEQYETTKNTFNDALKSMEDISKRSRNKFILERIDKLKKVAELRIKYCAARLNVEKARILAKQGEHLEAAELFASAAADFRYVCNFFKIERERVELEAVYLLCRAWETMELAEKYGDPQRFAEAASLFVKASGLFLDSKLKLLASGNAAFCQALENGCIFDEESEINVKTELYSKIRANLRRAATSYQKGGFVSGTDWVLATITYFDAAWHLIRADNESELEQRKELLGIGSEYLQSSAELFEKAGNIHKKNEVLERLDMVEKEEKIMFSALNSIKKPTIYSSTVGIIAPACSLETSQSPRLGEIQQITEESRRVLIKRSESPVEIYECETNLNILHISDIQEGRFGIKEDITEVNEAYYSYLSDLRSKIEIIHRKNKIDIIVISGDLASVSSKEEYDNLTNEFLPILNEVFLKGKKIVPKNKWIIVPGNHDVEWERGIARFNNFIQFCQENGFHHYNLNDPESIYSRIVCKDKSTGNFIGIIGLNSCLDIIDESSGNAPRLSNSYFSIFSKNWDGDFREMPKIMVCHHTLHAIKSEKFDHALNKLRDNNVLLALVGDIHKSESHADEISNIRCIPAGTITASKSERQVGIDEVSRQFNLINLNLQSGYVKWYTYLFEGTWREIKNESFYLEHPSFSK